MRSIQDEQSKFFKMENMEKWDMKKKHQEKETQGMKLQ